MRVGPMRAIVAAGIFGAFGAAAWACARGHGEPTAPSALRVVLIEGGAASPPSSADVALADAGTTTVGAPVGDAGPRRVPALATTLGRKRVAVLLAEGGAASDAPAELLARSPIVSIAKRLHIDALGADAKANLAVRYVLGSRDGKRCTGAREGVAVLHRIPSYDPTLPSDALEPKSLEGTFVHAKDGASIVALVEVDEPCDALWALPATGAPLPQSATLVDVTRERRTTALLASREVWGQMTRAWGNAPSELGAWTVGSDHLFAWYGSSGPSVWMECVLFAGAASKAYPLAAASMCPGKPEAAIVAPEVGIVLLFEHARAHVEGDRFEVTYFPTAYFGVAGGP